MAAHQPKYLSSSSRSSEQIDTIVFLIIVQTLDGTVQEMCVFYVGDVSKRCSCRHWNHRGLLNLSLSNIVSRRNW